MRRRKFLTTTLASAALGASAPAGPGAKAEATTNRPAGKSFVVKAGQDRFNEPIKYQGINPNLVKISTRDTDGQLAVFEYEGFAKIGPPLHVHLHQDEIFYVVEGEFLFKAGDEKQILRAGDTIFLPRNVPHTWLQRSEKGKLLYFLQPAGGMETFFKTMSAFQRPPTFAEEQAVSRANGVETLGPPLQPE